jgi:hypothetical protein
MAKPKLALIPAAQGTKLFSVLPSDGVGDFTFARGSVATRINAQGLIENVASGQSRLDYPMIDGVQKGCPHHILEPQRGNVCGYSDNLTQWSLTNGTLSSNSVISPDGTLNADKVVFNNVALDLKRTVTVVAGTTYTFSFYIKLESGTGLQGRFYDNSNGANIEYYDYSNQVLGTDWTRVTRQVTTPSGCTQMQVWLLASSSSLVTASFWGAQLEVGSYETSYIPTSTTAVVTRSAETASGAGNSTTFNDSEGVFMVECSTIADSDVVNEVYCISINDGGATGSGNRVELLWFSDGKFYTQVGNSGQEFISSDTFNNKILIKYGSGSYDLYVNGFRRITDTFTSMSGLVSLDFKRQGSYTFKGKTKQIQYFDSILADTQLEQLTSWQSFTDMAEGQLYTIE